MELNHLIKAFSGSREKQEKAIFSSLFIISNKLQTIFDYDSSDISLKQFMLLTMIRQSQAPLTLTKLGQLLGCSRQNIKKLAIVLEKKGYVVIENNPLDVRTYSMISTPKLHDYFEEIAEHHNQCLANLFSSYTDEEIQMLFKLMMGMHKSVEQLKEV